MLPSVFPIPRVKTSRGYIFLALSQVSLCQCTSDLTSVGALGTMAGRATQYSAQVLRARQSALPLPPAHRGPMLSSLIWSLSSPSASLPYLKPPCSVPPFTQVIKRGMATIQNSNNSKVQESEDDSLARFHRAVRDESESSVDMWSFPLETLGASSF